MPLYRDDGHHLTVPGSKWAGKKIYKKIKTTGCFDRWKN
jgi:hypothetical protein